MQTISFTFSSESIQSMKEHAERTYPYECCGALLSDRANLIIEARPLPNLSLQKNRFEMDIFSLDALYDEALRRGLSVVGVYHSHVEVGAYFSREDQKMSGLYPVNVVVSVRQGRCDEMKSFAWKENQYIETRWL